MKLIVFLLKYALRYLGYFLRARTRFDVHSPFVSDLIEATVEDSRWYYIFDRIQEIKEKLLLNDDVVHMEDHGAGSQLGMREITTVNKVARYSSISPVAGRLLFRIVRFLRPAAMLELGTCLGVSAIYQLSAFSKAKMITIEGNPEIAALAGQNLRAAGFGEAEVISGAFSDVLPALIERNVCFDLFHFDGDHRYQPTLDYFEQCLQMSCSGSVFCIGDIYWSAEMERAWKDLKQHPRVRLSVDFFHFGLLFLRPDQREKEDFTLIAARWKPWRMGFF